MLLGAVPFLGSSVHISQFVAFTPPPLSHSSPVSPVLTSSGCDSLDWQDASERPVSPVLTSSGCSNLDWQDPSERPVSPVLTSSGCDSLDWQDPSGRCEL